MVDAYATRLGDLTLALNADRLLLEDSASNSILSLHPAVRLAQSPKVQVFGKITGFSTAPGSMEVSWGGVPGLEARTVLLLEGPCRLRMTFRIANTGDAPVQLEALHPLYVPSEGPGACALGMHDLRMLLVEKPGDAPLLVRVQGENIRNALFGAWFAAAGSPMLLLAALEKTDRPPMFTIGGARGRILRLSVDCPAGDAALEPGKSLAAPALRLEIGNEDVRAALRAWADEWGDPLAVSLADFDPSGELVEREPEEEEPDGKDGGDGKNGKNGKDGGDEGDEGDGEDGTGRENCAGETPAGLAGKMPAVRDSQLKSQAIPGQLRPGRCASFRRTLRANDGIWPRWAAGRRHAPLVGTSARSRARWKREA